LPFIGISNESMLHYSKVLGEPVVKALNNYHTVHKKEKIGP